VTDSYHSSGDPAVQLAGLDGIGNKTAERLEDLGITKVRHLAHADAEQLASALAANDPRWKAETWRQRAGAWIATAQAHVSSQDISGESRQVVS
jgi:predicted flap endonuclease-1-like 5' DNA nuclease